MTMREDFLLIVRITNLVSFSNFKLKCIAIHVIFPIGKGSKEGMCIVSQDDNLLNSLELKRVMLGTT